MKRLIDIYHKKERLVAGLMSGTSLDGVDAALLSISGGGAAIKVRLIAFKTAPYDESLRQEIMAVCGDGCAASTAALCKLNFKLGELFAAAVVELCADAGLAVHDIDIIGSHGQTVSHIPGHGTLQIGEPAVIAERTGVITVADFRVRDMAAGGQGAPLVPYSEFILYSHPEKTMLLQNIGGIANVTLLAAGAGPDGVLAFDTGPGNMMIDACVEILTQGKERFDRDGELAAASKPHRGMLAELLTHPYLTRPLPKTTGREEFGREFTVSLVRRYLARGLSGGEIVAALTAFTAKSMAAAYRDYIFPRCRVDEVIVSGGGSYNKTLLAMLQAELPEQDVIRQEELGFSSDAKEAVAFAVLANETVCGHANNLPGVTGAGRAVIMGKISL